MPARADPVRSSRRALRVGGLTPLSLTDYPGCLSAVVFCQGCPWRCGYCHNPHLLPARAAAEIAWSDILSFLRRRRGLLDAVVFSGGEPLAQPGLADAMRAVRQLGFRIGLHTGGAYPSRLAQVLPRVDWVGFDIKASFAEYARITTVRGSGDRARESAKLLLAGGVTHEFRTTIHPRQHDAHGIEHLAGQLAELGVRNYVLQEFRTDGCTDEALLHDLPESFLTESWCARVAPKFDSFTVRRA
ncbi:MAG: anaerobic ribonucleoside-triphosphate reductase activating protein [Betaproteobacteria bacterium]